MKYKCCNCKNIFSGQEVLNGPSDDSEGCFSCPNCHVNIQKSASRESNIKGMNYIITTFIIGVVGNSVWGDAFHKVTEMSWLVASFSLFVLSIVVVILVNLKNDELFITNTELADENDT